MANYLTTDTELTSVADAIRTKGGTSAELTYPTGFVSAINAIPTGGGGSIDPSWLQFSSNVDYFNYGGYFTPILQTNKSSVSITNVTSGDRFLGNQQDWSNTDPTWNDWSWLTITIPEEQIISNYFYGGGWNYIEALPKLRIVNDDGTKFILVGNNSFNSCQYVKSLTGVFPHANCLSVSSSNAMNCFAYMGSLRQFPDEVWYKDTNNKPIGGSTYNGWFRDCYALDKIENLPILREDIATSANAFTSFLGGGYRLSKITFATNNGTPFDINITRNLTWSLTSIGNAYNGFNFANYGISMDKKVTDQASYEALKNDPDWFAIDIAYSRFNHDSAVALINSLPNNTNTTYKVTIQLYGNMGANTDGGAISTLTAEEIAVATNKNWVINII